MSQPPPAAGSHVASPGSRQAVRPKHVPQRMCSACRRVGPKAGFVRVVLTPKGTIEIDLTGKKPGRGAYLCRQKSCLEKGLSEKVLGHAFRTRPPVESLERLKEYMKDITTNDLVEGEN